MDSERMNTDRKMISSMNDSVETEKPNKLTYLDMKTEQRTVTTFEESRQNMKKTNDKAMKKLIITIILSIIFMAVEIVGGLVSNSVALLADAGHLATDALGVSISVIALCIAQCHATKRYSYGFHRAEVLGALISIFSIWIMLIFLCIEAVERVKEPPEIEGSVMLATAILSIVFNLIMIKVLHSGDGHSHGYGQKCGGHQCGGHSHDEDHKHEHSHSHDRDQKQEKHNHCAHNHHNHN